MRMFTIVRSGRAAPLSCAAKVHKHTGPNARAREGLSDVSDSPVEMACRAAWDRMPFRLQGKEAKQLSHIGGCRTAKCAERS